MLKAKSFEINLLRKRAALSILLSCISCAGVLYCKGGYILAATISVLFLLFGFCRIRLSKRTQIVAAIVFILLFSFLLLWLTQYIMQLDFAAISFAKCMIGLLISAVCIVACLAVTGSPIVSIGIFGFIMLLLATIDYYVYSLRYMEFTPMDIFAARTAMSVIDGYDITPDLHLIIAWCIFSLGLSVVSMFPIKLARVRCAVVSLPVCILLALVISVALRNEQARFYANGGSLYNGFLVNFCLEIREMFVKTPSGYNIGELEEMTGPYQSENHDERLPNIIVIMNESFTDFRYLNQNIHTDQDVMPFLDSLKDNTVRGYTLVPVFGGATSNSEWEFLTSNSLAFLNIGSPYQQYVHNGSYSIASVLEQKGYDCIGMHPFDEYGWHRKAGYEMLGFKKTMFFPDFPREDKIRQYISDREMYEKITSLFEENNSNGNAPLFIFGVSIQNHGGYTYDSTLYPATVHLSGMTREYPDVEQYLSLIHESDKAMEYLIQYLSNVDEDTVVLFFGDHCPKVENAFYEEISGKSFLELSKEQSVFTVPFYIWANYDIEEKEVGLTSLNYLANYVYEISGLDAPPYAKFLGDVQISIPAMNHSAFYSSKRECIIPYDEADKEEKELLNLYWQIEYNNIFDSQHKLSIFK